jgi:lipopolysaccharide export system protein LptC
MSAIGERTPADGQLPPRHRALAVLGEIPGDPYSRRVALLKRLLPAVGATLMLLVLVWPRLVPLIERMRMSLPAIDLREARELRMINPRYAGLDRLNRPFVVTAAVGRQVPQRQDLMAVEHPHGDLRMNNGMHVVVTALTGVYQSQTQLLDLFDDVTMVRDDGVQFLTKTAHLNVANNTGEGDDPIVGHGPSGDITAQGFRIMDGGNRILFTGASDLVITQARKLAARPSEPPGLPPPVAQTAAQIETAAPALLAAPAARPAATAPRRAGETAAAHKPAASATAKKAQP